MFYRLFDKKFAKNKSKYILQCLLATVSIFIILLIYSTIYDLVIVASLGASSFIIFLLPHTASSQPGTLMGSYIIGVIVGSLFSIILGLKFINNTSVLLNYSTIFCASLAVGIAMFLMVVTNTEHPPAAGLALGLVFDQFSFINVLIILLGIITLTLIRIALKKYLINLT